MNMDQLEGSWKQIKGEAKRKWGLLTEDDLTAAAGKQEVLVGKLQEHYGLVKEEAQKQLDDFLKNLKHATEARSEHHIG